MTQRYFVVFQVCFLSLFSPLSAQNLLVNNSDGELLNFDADGCTTSLNINISSYTDIAKHPNGFLYAINSSGQLYEIDLGTGATNLTYDFAGASNYFALTADADGVIFAAAGSGALASYNPTTGEDIIYPNMGVGASGDLTFYQGQMYMASFDNTIISVNPNNPEDNEVFIDFSTSGATIFGIVSSVEGCEVETYAFSNDNSAEVYRIDWENQSFDFVCTIPHRIFGGSSEFEFDASGSLVDIEDIILSNDGCGDATGDATIVANSEAGGIVYSLDNENFQSDNTFTGLLPGDYTVYLEDAGGCIGNQDFIVFSAFVDIIESSAQNATCGNANGIISVVANTGSGGVGYSINGGNLQQGGTFTGLAPGTYEITATDLDECTSSVTLTVTNEDPELDPNALNVSSTSCGEDNGSVSVTTDFGNGNLTYTLNGGSSQGEGSFTNLAPGDYTLTIADSDGCTVESSFTIAGSSAFSLSAPEVTAATCSQGNGTASFTSEENLSISIEDLNLSVNSNSLSNLAEGGYEAVVSNSAGCTDIVNFVIPPADGSCNIYIPNVFSPNNDGVNDIFKAYSDTEVILTEMLVFDRWGELIYQEEDVSTADLSVGWDGTFRGREMEDGVYVYVITFNRGDFSVLESGDFTLLR